MPSCQNCETILDLRWHYCPNCGISTASDESKPGDVKIVENSPVSMFGQYGKGVREQVFEVVVRQAMKGAPWREICSGPMLVNQISEGEVEAEVRRRQADDNDGAQPARIPKRPKPPDDESSRQVRVMYISSLK